MANEKNDQSVLSHIDELVKEEERLYAKNELSDQDQARLAEVKVALDQCWDLLRQRRALRREEQPRLPSPSRGRRAPAHPATLRRDAVAAPVSAAPMCLARRRARWLAQLAQPAQPALTSPACRARPSPEA